MLIHHEIDRVICVIAMSTAYKVIALIYIICHIHNFLSVNMHFTSKIMIIFPMIYFRVKYKTKNEKGIYNHDNERAFNGGTYVPHAKLTHFERRVRTYP